MQRYDLVYFFDVTDGNPNGDPDAGNLPRIDAETGQGLVTDVALKRKIRNYVAMTKGEEAGWRIYVQDRAVLNRQHEQAWQAVSPETDKAKRDRLPKDAEKARELTRWMCKNFFDIRAFGAVMTTEVNCGQVRGPVQLGMARSLDPIVSQEHAVTRCAVTNERDLEKERTMGRKFAVPYALYRVHGYLNPLLAEQTGFGDADLGVLKQALDQMFEYDRSAARGLMKPVRCIAFGHDSQLGNARADQLFSRVTSKLAVSVATEKRPPRQAFDYDIQIDMRNLSPSITVEEWVAESASLT
jgi:CRISPR-associated protein Csd2